MIIVGCGAIGRQLGLHYLGQSEPVVGWVRSEDRAERLRGLGVVPLRADLDAPERPALDTGGSRLFYLVPPPRTGERDARVAALVAGFRSSGSPRRIVYLSTTGVYGDCGGAWVDETRPTAPQAGRARRRLDAEARLSEWSRRSGGELVILRVAGIYGPGRLPLERLRRQLPLVRASEAPYSNRIHAHDLVQVCIAAMERGRAGAIFNVSDGNPTTMIDYFNRLADLAGLPRPPAIPLREARRRLSPGMFSYMQESRRLSNRKIREQLGVKLKYPTLDEGLPASLEEEPIISIRG